MVTPTVAYNVAGLKDSVLDNNTGLLTKPNPESCSEKILLLFENKPLYNTLRKNGIEWSKKISWDKASKESLRLIEDSQQLKYFYPAFNYRITMISFCN